MLRNRPTAVKTSKPVFVSGAKTASTAGQQKEVTEKITSQDRKPTVKRASTPTQQPVSTKPGGKSVSSIVSQAKTATTVKARSASAPKAQSTVKTTKPAAPPTTTSTRAQSPSAASGAAPKHAKLSRQRYDPHKASNPFSDKKKHKTKFGKVYDAGGIPCRIQHSAAKMSLQWDRPVSEQPYDMLLLCAEGLRETDHPYVFVARQAFKEFTEAEDSKEKIAPLLSQIVVALRQALQTPEDQIFEAGLNAIVQLAAAVGESFIEHLAGILPQMSKKSFDKKFKQKIATALQDIVQTCGPEVVEVIKKKVPTYSF